MSNTVNLNSNNDCIKKKQQKRALNQQESINLSFITKFLSTLSLIANFNRKRKQNQTISQLSFIQERIEHICLYLTNLFFFSYKPYQHLGISVASSGKNYKQISTSLFVSFSVNSSSGVSFSGPTSTANENFPKVSCRNSTVSEVFWTMLAFFVHPSCLQPQIQVFRNHNVGKT